MATATTPISSAKTKACMSMCRGLALCPNSAYMHPAFEDGSVAIAQMPDFWSCLSQEAWEEFLGSRIFWQQISGATGI